MNTNASTHLNMTDFYFETVEDVTFGIRTLLNGIYNINFKTSLDCVFYDFGDVNVVPGNCEATCNIVEDTVNELFDLGVRPITIGGEHSASIGVIKALAEKAVIEYESHMYNHDFHRVSYVLDDFVRSINKHWVNNVKIADSTGDIEFRKQLIADCFYACKVMAVLIHPIAPEGCEMFREYLNIGEKLWDWNYILDPISAFVDNMDSHEVKYLEPRVDFFKKHECQLEEKGEAKSE